MSFQSTKFKCWLEVKTQDGQDLKIDLRSVAARFPINQIPNCNVSVCVGIEATTQKEAAIHQLKNEILTSRPAKVYVEREIFTSTGLQDGVLQKERRVVSEVLFDGYVSGVSVRKVVGGLEFTIEIQHWLYKLDHTSVMSQLHMPTNPIDFIFPAAVGAVPPGFGLVQQTGVVFQTTGLPIVQTLANSVNVADDFWGKVIYPIMVWFSNPEQTAGNRGIGFPFLSSLIPGLDATASIEERKEVANLLRRFEPSFDENFQVGKDYQNGVPARLRNNPGHILSAAIANYLTRVLNRPIANSTFWSKILEVCSTFDLMIVPLVDRALVVPVTLGLRNPKYKIPASEYSGISTSVGIPKPLRGVILYGGRATETNFNLVDANDKNNAMRNLMVGGLFERAKKKGAFLILEAPAWADANVLAHVMLADQGAPKDANVANLANNKNVFVRAALVKRRQESALRLRKILDDYAAALFYRENLKPRSGNLFGIFRTDIGPGSLLQIESIREEVLKDHNKMFYSSFVAMVAQVDLFVDAQANSAGTSFQLLGIRSLEENAHDDYTSEKHPLWETQWNGAPLVIPKGP